ncbi:PAS domain-containing protein [Halorubrum sp. CBA1229]|uniref:hybrid sensor histidine kinase/response regulator n=1 Tax=Halorubrum sp. CBA1229 TaxID=1853699 RepID=UPI000F3E095C|nr:PAS domain-containing protein [Halorubrum sp. CBA1229]QKY16467.1 PAS domain-containing protein [Halorubrum sp. CBA1229]
MAGTIDTINVLHVDDEPEFADLTATFLEREDDRFEVETATSASEALADFAISTFDCIVSDHDMPSMNGIEFLEAVREEHPDLPFILYTGKGSEEVASDAITAGVTDYLQKGSGTDHYTLLANRIENVVESRRSQQKLAERDRDLRRYKHMINSMYESACLYDEHGRFEIVNEYLANWYNTTREALEGEESNLIRIIQEEAETGDPYQALLNGRRDQLSGELEAEFPNHGYAVLEYRLTPLTIDGTVEGVVGVTRDITAQKQHQRELEQTNALLSTLFDALPQGVLVEDESRNVLAVNQQLFRLFELPGSPEGVAGADCERLAEDLSDMFADSEQFVERINELITEREQVDEEELTLADGRTFERTHRPIELPDGGGHLWVYRDVTARKAREREIETIQRRFEAVLENTPTPMFMKDDEGEYIFVNQAYRDLFDLRDEEIVGRTDHEIHLSEMATEVQKNDRAVIERGEPIEAEEPIVVDGDERIFLTTKVPIYDTGERSDPDSPVAVFGVATDITERTVREQQLEALNQVTQELMRADTRDEVLEIGIETTRDLLGIELNAIHLYDEDAAGLVPAAATDAVSDLIGDPPVFTAEDSIAWRVYQRGEPRAVDDVHEDPDRYNPDTPVRSELYLPLADHGILIAGSPSPETFDDEDRLLSEILAGGLTRALEQVERTEQLRARERELTEQNDRLEEFASIVSHDLRNPINVAEGRLELAATECDSEHLEHVGRAHERMRTLIEDLLTLAREGETVTDFEAVALTALVERCWANVETDEATLVTDTERTVQADKSRLKQLFENLIRNAIDHGGGDVTVTVGEMDTGFYVEDDGPGIPADEREAIFEAGYSTRADGTGFGLSIVKRIVEAHEWEIDVTDGGEGGARFEITGVEFGAE